MKPIPYGHQSISEDDIQQVIQVLKGDLITQGPMIDRFEKTVRDYCGAAYSVAVNSATSALHLACRALELGPEDFLWTSPNTFVATANCAVYCGAQVDFVDIDPRTYNMSLSALEEKLKKAKQEKKLPRVVVPVHFAGQSCDMKTIHRLSKEYGFSIIEDASHAIGGFYEGKPVGSCQFSDLAVFSFHPVKIITSGEGGMVLTNNSEFYSKIKLLRSHGIVRDLNHKEERNQEPWYYELIDLGYNYRITDIQAALGNSQMSRLNEFVERRNHLAKRYDKAFQNLPVTTPLQQANSLSAYHLYVIRLQWDQIRKTRSEIFTFMRERGIQTNVHYIPVHLHPYYQKKFGFKKGDFPEVEKYYQEAMTLPLYPDLSEQDQDRVIETLSQCLQK